MEPILPVHTPVLHGVNGSDVSHQGGGKLVEPLDHRTCLRHIICKCTFGFVSSHWARHNSKTHTGSFLIDSLLFVIIMPTTFVLDASPNARSACKKCKEKMTKGTLRIASISESTSNDMIFKRYVFLCFLFVVVPVPTSYSLTLAAQTQNAQLLSYSMFHYPSNSRYSKCHGMV